MAKKSMVVKQQRKQKYAFRWIQKRGRVRTLPRRFLWVLRRDR